MIPQTIRAMLESHAIRCSTFDAGTLQAFRDVWQKRYADAKEYQRREDLRQSAEAVLDFIRDRVPENLPLCICRQDQKLIAVLLDEAASECMIMGSQEGEQSAARVSGSRGTTPAGAGVAPRVPNGEP